MIYIADYLNKDDSSGRTIIIHADNDKAAHELALINMPDGFALAQIHRAPVSLEEMPFDELIELTIQRHLRLRLKAAEERAEKAEAERDRYREALDFYADEKNYDDSGTPGKAYSIDYGDYGTDWDLDPDFGQRAREALGREGADNA